MVLFSSNSVHVTCDMHAWYVIFGASLSEPLPNRDYIREKCAMHVYTYVCSIRRPRALHYLRMRIFVTCIHTLTNAHYPLVQVNIKVSRRVDKLDLLYLI